MTFSTQPHILLRWQDGLVHSGEGAEQYVEVRGIKTHEEAQELADSLSEAAKTLRTTTRESGEVWGPSYIPRGSYDVLDGWLSGQIQSISAAAGEDARAFVTIEGGDKLRIIEEEWERRIARINANSASEWASPFPDGKPADQPSTTIPSFTWTYRPPDIS